MQEEAARTAALEAGEARHHVVRNETELMYARHAPA
jgi:hypothetical protein